MKKLLLISLTIGTLLFSSEKIIKESKGWKLVMDIDDFSDKKTCSLYSKNLWKKNYAGLWIKDINLNTNEIIPYANGTFLGQQITYRIDKNEAKIVNPKLASITNQDYDEMIQSFGRGKELKIKIIPRNNFVTMGADNISLFEFEKLYNLAKICNY